MILDDIRARAAAISHGVPRADVIAHWHKAVQAGQITWDELRALQASLMPPCTVCGGVGLIGECGYWLCQECFEVRHAV